jgi:acyl-CoA reductase-like NAD-dependent aldehyde dehydrogenase
LRHGRATGVVAVLAPQQSPLLGLVSVVAPSVAGGNTAVVVASKARPWLAEHADGDGIT